ncbi:lipid-A-disaccharide synthase [Rudanella lutea]|uniref:lipid-A-disaccharide synthase n=1 Tax=Rudanella lutea TaxID=451374 RepID=UPI00039AACBA|nr:lipid-A-disaccharide synthase [Rudanella lutea]
MRYYFIAGERSGDLHGGNLIRSIRQHDPDAQCRAYGGEQMQEAGATLVRHYRQMAFMGFIEVAKNLGTIRRIMRECQADLLANRPDVLVLIDYAGFNLRMARFAKKHGIPVFYYISPKVWAWNQKRALTIKALVDRLFVIFPFEVDFFKQYDYEVEYVGNPLMDALTAFRPNPNFAIGPRHLGRPVVALLPGSRKQEVENMLPVMLEASRQFTGYQFAVGTVDNLPRALYDRLLANYPDVKRVEDAAYDLLHVAEAALVTSGTATLETALLNVPEVVLYKTPRWWYEIGKRILAVPYLSLVNLIAGRLVVHELIYDCTPTRVADELRAILVGGKRRDAMLRDYAEVQQKVGGPGASERAGKRMVELVKSYATHGQPNA